MRRGQVWRRVGIVLARTHWRTLGTMSPDATSAATIPMANSAVGEIGREDSVDPDVMVRTSSRAKVTTNWLTWTRATVAAASVVDTPRRVSIRRFRAAGPMPAGAASPTNVAAVCTSVARHRGSLTGENATN